jgi:hypothetical protein
MTPQATNKKEGGLTSSCGHIRKLHTFTQKELEIVKAAQELLGAPTIGGGNAWSGVGGVGVGSLP